MPKAMNLRLWPVFLGQLRFRRGASVLSMLAIALGVALGVGVNAVNRAALDEFAHGLRTLSGQADLEVRGPRAGFDERLYPQLARLPEVALASPALEIDAAVVGRGQPLRIVGIDPFRALRLQPALVPSSEGSFEERFAVLDPAAIYLSAAAASWLGTAPKQRIAVLAGLQHVEFEVAALLPGVAQGQRLGVVDIATAQERFGRTRLLTRIDLRLRAGVDTARAQRTIEELVPPGVLVIQPEESESRAASLSRSYRVNLNMLALIALVTGAFLVFSTQALAVVRRRAEIAFLRALGITRGELVRWLLLEGVAVGVVGALIGLALGYAVAHLALNVFGGDLGAGFFPGSRPALAFDLPSALGFCLLGVAAAAGGALAPALEAGHTQPALALKAGDDIRPFARLAQVWPGLAVLLLGVVAAFAPPIYGLPVLGYLAIACFLLGAILLLPRLGQVTLAWLPAPRSVPVLLAWLQLRGAPGHAVVASAGILASVALTVAMAIMIASFRDSVDAWLTQVLPADLYLRAGRAGESGFIDPDAQRAIAATPGVARLDLIRHQNLLLDAARPAVSLIARRVPVDAPQQVLPLVQGGRPSRSDVPALWASEAMADLYGYRIGGEVALPLGGRATRFVVAGIWRDYARQHGAIVIDLDVYRRLTGDLLANDAGITLEPGRESNDVAQRLRLGLEAGAALEIALPEEIRDVTLGVFDRTFAVTYALEAVAVIIGLFGVAASFGTLAAARRREFGVLRHVGMTRGQIGAMLAAEGALVSALGVAGGIVLGTTIAVVLIEVVNRQSFHWSMDMIVPWAGLALFAAVMVALATAAAVIASRQAMHADAVRAVREDW